MEARKVLTGKLTGLRFLGGGLGYALLDDLTILWLTRKDWDRFGALVGTEVTVSGTGWQEGTEISDPVLEDVKLEGKGGLG